MTVESKNARQDTEEGGTLEGKRSGGTAKGEIEEVNGGSIYLHGQHVTEFSYYVSLWVVLYDNLHMHPPHSQLTN